MQTGDAVDQLTNMTLKGVEVAGNLTGKALVNLATFLVAVLKEEKRSKGKTRIDSFNGKPTKVFMVKTSDLKTFAAEAKKYGVLYAAIYDRKNPDGLCDVIVNAADAAKVNRIAERFALSTVDVEQIRKDIEKEQAARETEAPQVTATDNSTQVSAENPRAVTETELDNLLGSTASTKPDAEKPAGKELTENELDSLMGITPDKQEAQLEENPMIAWTGEKTVNPFAPSSEVSSNTSNTPDSRPSVRKELGEIKEQLGSRDYAAASLMHTRSGRGANVKSEIR